MLADIGGTWTRIRWELQVFLLKVEELVSPLSWIEMVVCVGMSHRGVSYLTCPTNLFSGFPLFKLSANL